MNKNHHFLKLLIILLLVFLFAGQESIIWGGFPINDSTFGLIMYGNRDTDSDYWNDLDNNLDMNVLWSGAGGEPYYNTWKAMLEIADNRGMLMCGPGSDTVFGDYAQNPTYKYCKAYSIVPCWNPDPGNWEDPGMHSNRGDSTSLPGDIPVWASGTNPDTLYPFLFGPKRPLRFKDPDYQSYTLIYKIAIEDVSVDTTIILGFIKILYGGENVEDSTYLTKNLTSNMFDTNYGLVDIQCEINLDSIDLIMENFQFQVYNTYNKNIYVNQFKIYHQDAMNLMEEDTINARNQIKTQVTFDYCPECSDTVMFGPWAKDEPIYFEFPAYGEIQKIVMDTLEYTDHPDQAFKGAHIFFVGDFIKVAEPKFVNYDGYPIKDATTYYGHPGLQPYFNDYSDILSDITRYCKDSTDFVEKVYYTLQAFNLYDTGESRYTRRITPSEFRCNAGLGLAAGVDGFCVFKYGTDVDGLGDTLLGLTNVNGEPRDTLPDGSSLYSSLKDYVVPLVRGIESTYLDLTCENTYRVCPVDSISELGAATYIDSITYWSDTSSTSNPDAGWFQVAEFKDSSNVEHLLVVNRSCNSDDTTVTPDIWATIYLDTGTFDDDQYVITNVDTNADEKIYTGLLPGDELCFTTILEAGESKLFKIESASDINWTGSIDCQYIYQGEIDIIQDAFVDTGSTLIIRAPAKIRAHYYDNDPTKDMDTLRVELTIKGELIANGTPEDEILFTSYNTGGSEAGDWYALWLDDNSEAEMSYCKVEYSVLGFAVDYPESFHIENCRSTNNSYSGMCFRYDSTLPNDSAASVITSEFDNNGKFGIYTQKAGYFSGCYIHHNDSSGVKTEGYNTFHNDTIAYNGDYGLFREAAGADSVIDCIIHSSDSLWGICVEVDTATTAWIVVKGGIIDSCGYGGIKLQNVVDSLTYLIDIESISNNTVGGIFLDHAGATIRREQSQNNPCIYIANQQYGVYCNTSEPELHNIRFENEIVDLWWDDNGMPAGSELSIDSSCFKGDSIYILNELSDTLDARINYFDDTASFRLSGPIDTTDYLTIEPCIGGGGKEGVTVDLIPSTYALSQNYPNPFNPTTTFNYQLPKDCQVKFTIYNLMGQKVVTLLDEKQNAGYKTLNWDSHNQFGRRISSGIYFYLLETPNWCKAKKMLMLK